MLKTISLILSLAPTPEEAFKNVKVPEGYSKQLIAAEPEVMDVVAFCFDDDGNIYAAEGPGSRPTAGGGITKYVVK